MGVKGLWRLLMPIGRRISIETLEGKILAVDASIWLTQFLKAMRDPDSGKVRPAAHLIGFFRRLCKLRYQGIRPVFVFDGATPEIKQRELRERRKRREQFSNDNHSDEALQRMAKRLLVHHLKKQGTKVGIATVKKHGTDANETLSQAKVVDTTTSTGAYAPGFYDPEMDHVESSSKLQPPQESIEQALRDKPEGPQNYSPEPKHDSKELVEILEEGTDYLEQATSRANAQSDWDTVVIDDEGHVATSDMDAESRARSARKSENIRNYASADPKEFDVEYVASLPSSLRKDMIEEAQRKRRLQSRREFMKVAYDPEGLSKCQLRNFLKSTRLNQNIHKMAQQASKTDSKSVGGKNRIIFEMDAGVDDSERKKANKEEALKTFRLNKKLSFMASDEEGSDNDFERQDDTAFGDNRSFQVVPKPRAVVDDEDESDSDENPSDGVAMMPTQALARSSDDEMVSGGFIKKDLVGKKPVRKTSHALKAQRGDRRRVIVIDDDESSEEDRKMPGRKADYTVTRQFIDANLARALQEAKYNVADDDEDEAGGFIPFPPAAPAPGVRAPFTRTGTNEKESSSDNFTSSIILTAPIKEGNESSSQSDEDDIPWEDGDGRSDGSVQAIESNRESGPSASLQSQEAAVGYLQTDLIGDSRLINAEKFEARSEGRKDHGSKGSKEEGVSVEWVNGEIINIEDPIESEKGKGILDTLPQECKKEFYQDFMCNESESPDDGTGKGVDSWGDDCRVDSARKAQAMKDALEHAQTTAGNLTNWAGRAFRRAVEQHAVENGLPLPDAAKPKVMVGQCDGQTPARPCVTEGEHVNTEKEDNHLEVSKRQARNASRPEEAARPPAAPCPDSSAGATILSTLEEYQEKWEHDRNQQDRDLDTVTDEMRAEVISLLQLFGVPFMEAPAEAEAQCVMLEKLGLVDGIVTEDSDAFVFGGQRIYKNIFDDQKYVEVYDARDAEKEMNLTRDGLVAMAMLLGGDYTEGVKGVGIVNGMEIIEAFDVSEDLKAGLIRFRKWLDGFDPFDTLSVAKGKEEVTKEQIFHRKHHTARTRWVAPKFFPDPSGM